MRYFIMFVIIGFQCAPSLAQRKGYQKNDPYAKTQFYLGFRLGAGLTKAKVVERFSAFSSTTNPEETYPKSYQNFRYINPLAGMEFLFTYQTQFGISFQPNYRRLRFGYSNDYNWQDDTVATNTVSLKYTQQVKLDYLEFPLIFKYDFTKTRLRPYVQVGGFYGLLVSAIKTVEVDGKDQAAGGSSEYLREKITVGANDLFITSSYGWLAGAGCSYKMGNIRMTLDINYRSGMNNITDVKNRYTNNQLSGVGDVMDDIKIKNITLSVGCLFPIKYLTDARYEAVD